MNGDYRILAACIGGALCLLLLAPISPLQSMLKYLGASQQGAIPDTSASGSFVAGTASYLHHDHLLAAGDSGAGPVSGQLGFNHYSVIPEAYASTMNVTKKFVLFATSDQGKVQLPTSDRIALFTFNGSFPAPPIRVTQGDVVQITLVNKDIQPHSVDFHGAQLSVVPNFAAVQPGKSNTFIFVAANPGVWAYHCDAFNVFGLWEHPMKGMVGMLIVDPKNGYTPFNTNLITPSNATSNFFFTPSTIPPLAMEFSLVFGEDYLSSSTISDGGKSVHDFDRLKMFNEIPTYTYINGIPFGYAAPLFQLTPWNTAQLADVIDPANMLPGNTNPAMSSLATPNGSGFSNATHIHVKAGEHVRFFMLNAGEKPVPFHIVGEQLDRVTVGSTVVAKATDTYQIPAYESAIIDVVFEQTGTYLGVNHDYSMLFKGQMFVIEVDSSGTSIPANPSNTIAPASALADTSVHQARCLYGIGPDGNYNNNSGDDNRFVTRCAA